MTDVKDKHSKFARSILGIDIMEAQSLKKGTAGRVNNIEQIVLLYCEREAFSI